METILGFPTPPDANVEHGVALLGPSEFLDGALAAGRPFQEALPFAGRGEELAALVDFASGRGGPRITVLPGGAGTGKTSLIAAFADALATQRVGTSLRFATDIAATGVPSGPRLPPGPCVIVIDDANRKAAPAALLPMARDRRDVRFVLTTRPAGVARLSALFVQAGLSTDAVRVLPELGPLSPSEAVAAARHALGDAELAHAERLAAVAAGHPFVIGLGGRLVREGAIHPVALDQEAEFSTRAIERAHELLLLHAAGAADPKLLSGVLALVSMLAPVRTADERFLQGAGELLACRRRDLVSALRALEAAGVLERGPHGARVVPGPLSDHAVQRALVGTGILQGTLDERASALEESFGAHVIVPLLRNAAAVSNSSASKSTDQDYTSQLFEHVRKTLDAASAADRCRLLAGLRELAWDHPGAMLDLAATVMDSPPPTGTADRLTAPSVLYELPAIVRRAGLHPEHLPRAADLLWQLGRDDLRLQSPHPDHPMRVLRELAQSTTSPPAVQEALLDAVDRWLAESDAHEHKHSPLDVLDTFLAETRTSAGFSDERRCEMRKKALSALARCTRASSRRAALSGVSGLERVLGEGAGGSLGDRSEPGWRDGERLAILDMLRDAAIGTDDALVHFAVADALRRAARRASSEEVREAAEQHLAAVPTSPERRLFEALTQRSPAQRNLAEMPASEAIPGEGDTERPGLERRSADACRAVVDEMLAGEAEPSRIVNALGKALEALALAGRAGSPRLLLHVLSRKHPETAAAVCEAIMRAPEGPLGPHIASLIHALRESAPERAAELVSAIVSGGNATLCASIAQVFHRWVDKPRPGDREALRHLLGHKDGFVRRAALGALRTLARSSPPDAVELAVGVDLSEGPEVAEALFGALDAGGLIADGALAEEEIILFLSRLGAARSLDGHSTLRFLAHAGKRLPVEVTELMIDRIARAASGIASDATEYEPLPPEGLSTILSTLSSSPEWLTLLRRIRHLARARTGWVRFHAARLFHEASRSFALPSVEVLSEWVQEGGEAELEAVAALLEEAPASFLFAHLDLTAALLRRAHSFGDACHERVRRSLFSIATGQARPRAGRAALSQTMLRAEAREAASRLPPGSAEHRFFESVAAHAEALLAEEDADLDDDLFDI